VADPRPRLFVMNGDAMERSIDDPGLAALAREGWTVCGVHPVETEAKDGNKRVDFLMILWPPGRTDGSAIARTAWVVGGLLWMIGSLVLGVAWAT
jgi:hypothetical protein